MSQVASEGTFLLHVESPRAARAQSTPFTSVQLPPHTDTDTDTDAHAHAHAHAVGPSTPSELAAMACVVVGAAAFGALSQTTPPRWVGRVVPTCVVAAQAVACVGVLWRSVCVRRLVAVLRQFHAVLVVLYLVAALVLVCWTNEGTLWTHATVWSVVLVFFNVVLDAAHRVSRAFRTLLCAFLVVIPLYSLLVSVVELDACDPDYITSIGALPVYNVLSQRIVLVQLLLFHAMVALVVAGDPARTLSVYALKRARRPTSHMMEMAPVSAWELASLALVTTACVAYASTPSDDAQAWQWVAVGVAVGGIALPVVHSVAADSVDWVLAKRLLGQFSTWVVLGISLFNAALDWVGTENAVSRVDGLVFLLVVAHNLFVDTIRQLSRAYQLFSCILTIVLTLFVMVSYFGKSEDPCGVDPIHRATSGQLNRVQLKRIVFASLFLWHLRAWLYMLTDGNRQKMCWVTEKIPLLRLGAKV